MKTIWKFQLGVEPTDVATGMPRRHDRRDVTCGLDLAGTPCVWVEVDTDRVDAARSAGVVRRFMVVGTGNLIPDRANLVGSLTAAPFVWHVYELLTGSQQ